MSVLLIPTFDDPFYSQTTTLDGTDFVLDFRYNQRENAWYLSIADTDGNDLVRGVKIVCNTLLLVRYPDPRLPLGDIMAIPSTSDDSTPGLGELGEGKRVELTYFSQEEFDA